MNQTKWKSCENVNFIHNFKCFLSSKLLVQDWNVIVIFSLVEVASDWSSKVVFLSELLNLEAATVVS